MVGFNERFFFSIFVAPQYIGKVSNIHGIWTTNPPKKKQPGPRFMGAKWCKQTTWIPNSCLFRWKHCDTSHVYQSIDCRFGAWDFVKKNKTVYWHPKKVDCPQGPTAKSQTITINPWTPGPGVRTPSSPKNCGPEFPHELPGRKHSTTKGSGLLIPGIDSLLSAFVWIQLQHPQTPQ